MEPVFKLEGVRKRFGEQVVFDGVDLEIRPGEATVVIGPSGCGKSVLLKHMVGLIRPDAGKVWFHDTCISELDERRLSALRRRMGLLFQGGALFDSMTVQENVCFPLDEHGVGEPDERRERCGEVLALVGLDGLQERMPAELSGGQRKRVALARAVAMGPEVILYDEPTTGLDPIRADLINELILKLNAELDTTSVIVTHDMQSARKVGDRIVMLYHGRLIADTTPRELPASGDEVVRRFVEGRASDDELAAIRSGSFEQIAERSAG